MGRAELLGDCAVPVGLLRDRTPASGARRCRLTVFEHECPEHLELIERPRRLDEDHALHPSCRGCAAGSAARRDRGGTGPPTRFPRAIVIAVLSGVRQRQMRQGPRDQASRRIGWRSRARRSKSSTACPIGGSAAISAAKARAADWYRTCASTLRIAARMVSGVRSSGPMATPSPSAATRLAV